MSDTINKPPIGLVPKEIHDENRFNEVSAALTRYADAKIPVPKAWLEEYNEYLTKVAKG